MNTNMNKKLAGRVSLVTGGSRSIGAAIAKRLATDGAAVALADWFQVEREINEWHQRRLKSKALHS